MLREIFPSTIGIYHYLTNNHGDMFEGFLGYGSIGMPWGQRYLNWPSCFFMSVVKQHKNRYMIYIKKNVDRQSKLR